jgi:uncharacterized protein
MRLCLIALAGVLFVSSAHAQSFNCAYAGTPNEVTICEDARLSALDERMSSLFFRLRARLYGPDRVRLERDQAMWLNARGRCGSNPGCIGSAYRARIADLSGW